MEITENRTHLVRRSRGNRAKVTNSRLFDPAAVDGRSSPARRFHDILFQIVSDLGGADRLGEGKHQLARRAATLSMTAESLEVAAVNGEAFDVDLYGQITDRLGRCLQRLGLERVMKDATPTLADLLAASAELDGKVEP